MRSISNALYERECYTYSDYRSLIRPVESRNVGIISIYQLYIYIYTIKYYYFEPRFHRSSFKFHRIDSR